MSTRKIVLLIATAAAAIPLLLSANQASAAPARDPSRPVMTQLPATTEVGAVLDTSVHQGCGNNDYWSWLSPAYLRWTATDTQSGIDHYTFSNSLDEGPNVGWHRIGLRTIQDVGSVSDYGQECGGPPDEYAFSAVRAFNGDGLRRQLYLGYMSLCVIQEDGYAPGSCNPHGTQTPLYQGAWSTSSCACWSHGTAMRTRSAGARVSFTHRFGGEQLALVMAKGPNRGRVDIYIDGTLRRTLDNYSATSVNHTVVWTARPHSGSHTVSIVNEGTTGRPRSDFDAVAYLYG
jgi:hypothetical protein